MKENSFTFVMIHPSRESMTIRNAKGAPVDAHNSTPHVRAGSSPVIGYTTFQLQDSPGCSHDSVLYVGLRHRAE
jgi:hypothetical protein